MLKKYLLIFSWLFITMIIFLIDKASGIFAFFILFIILSFFISKNKIIIWIPAFLISWIWIYIAREFYSSYNIFKYSLYGVSLYPILAWPVLLYIFYISLYNVISIKNLFLKGIVLAGVYSIGIILIEYIGYNLLGIHLNYGKNYQGWPILNIFHCPWYMQLAYFLNGYIFIGFSLLIENLKLFSSSKTYEY